MRLLPLSTGSILRPKLLCRSSDSVKRIRKRLDAMADDAQDFYHRELETLDRHSIVALQRERLGRLLEELESNRFYQEKFRLAGLEMRSIRSAEDLRRLPFTTKSELIAEQQTHPPYGRLLTYSPARYRYFHQTSGTTFQPMKWLDTSEDWESWMRCWGHVYRGAGVSDDDVVFCAFSFGPYISHWAAIEGARHIGALCVSGGGLSSEQRLRLMRNNHCTVLVCTPTYALHLGEVAEALGLDLRRSDIRTTIHAGEPGASVPNVRRRIEDCWGARSFDHAGATEVGAWGFDCQVEDGSIHLNELEFIFEVVDPRTGETIEPGTRGELVATNLGRAGMPLLRYRTGDLVELILDPCACGRGMTRIRGGVLGRADDMLIVRGVNMYPSAIDNLVRGLPSIVEFEVEIRRRDGMDDLLLKLEVRDSEHFSEAERVVLAAFRSQFNIRVSVEQAARGSLPRYEFKARRYKRIAG